MARSMCSTACRIWGRNSRCGGARRTSAGSSPASRSVSWMIRTMASLLSRASELPFNTHAFRVFRHRAVTSKVTFGRDSKITAITPMGTRTLLSSRPFSRVRRSSVSPTGEGRSATLRRSEQMPSRRSALSSRRSYLGSSGSMRARSAALAASIPSARARVRSARSFRSDRISASLRSASEGAARLVSCSWRSSVCLSISVGQVQVVVMDDGALIALPDDAVGFLAVVLASPAAQDLTVRAEDADHVAAAEVPLE